MFCYSDNGQAMRAVDPSYEAAAGEVLFPAYATDDQLASAFPQYSAKSSAKATIAQIKALEDSITDRMRDEAMLDYETVISSSKKSPFYNMTARQALTSIRSQIDTLRGDL